MTAQAGERLIFKGEECWMATEPLRQYLHNKNYISFVPTSTACWRGYYGKWEIKNKKLYLIDLEANLGYGKVDLSYLFPGKNEVFANWFSGKIRIPQGEILEYVHMGYESLYKRDLILVFKNGLLINEYVVDNEKKYQNEIKKRKKQEIDMELARIEEKKKKKDKIIPVIIIVLFVSVLIGISFGVNRLIQQHTIITYLFSALIIILLLLIIGSMIFLTTNKGQNIEKQDKVVSFVGVNFLLLIFTGICIGIFYLIKWGTILAYFISATIIISLLYLIFNEVKKSNNKKNRM
ncbi:MAG: hypothetical protein M0P94_01345 [Candidatus Absconditabacterales bacterium]|nr:hypothetical protein [Candidatus Absconditabacterales bacterium]